MPTDKWPQKGESTMQRMRLATLGTVAAFGFALGLVSGLATASAQEKTFNLKLSHWVPPSHPLQKAIQDWADDIKKESNGTINYTIYPAQQLGKAFDHYDMARDGIADFVYVNPGYQPGRFPIIAAGELPFIVGNAKGGNLAIDAWYRKYAATEMKDVHYCFSFVLDPMAWHSSKKKIVVPGDIKGMKVRPAQGTIAAWVTQLGGTNVQSSAPEARDILAKGVADAITFPWGSMVLFGIDKVTKYDMDEPLGSVMFQWLMNPATYAAMSDRQKKIIDQHCTSQWAARFADPWSDFEHSGLAKLKAEPNHEVYKISDEQLAEWKKSAEPLKQKWANDVKKAGGDPNAIWNDLQASLKQYNAGF
jgi:TRAP-type C4-dicarboxylate transport system substrate-binding protein